VALAVAYGHGLAWSGPRLLSATRDGERLLLRFGAAGSGLATLDGGAVVGCAVAGADRRFVAARAEITGPDTLALTAPGVAEPLAVRYAWDDAPSFNLMSGDGLLAGPFRSDDWPVPTQEAQLPFGKTWPERQ
jgi:sialate O-acetylesterase